MKRYWIVVMLAMTLALSAQNVTAQDVTVEFWHTFGDAKRGDWIQTIADDYNKVNPGAKVLPVYKGISDETLQATVLAARQGTPPALVQVDGVSSQLALDSGIFQPVSDVKDVDFSDYIEPVVSYYTIGGKVNSVPVFVIPLTFTVSPAGVLPTAYCAKFVLIITSRGAELPEEVPPERISSTTSGL